MHQTLGRTCSALLTTAVAFTMVTGPMATSGVLAQSTDLGNGFMDHGPAAPVSTNRGIVSVANGQGRDIVLVWLYDTANTYALLQIGVETGETVEYPPPSSGCAPYASILSTDGRYYTHFANYFIEFDPVVGQFSFVAETTPRSAMSMTEDDTGVIWSATWPSSGVVSYNPQTGQFRDYGSLYEHPSSHYPRALAVDDQGWVYVGVGLAVGRILILDRDTGHVTAVGEGGDDATPVNVYRDLDGRVYGHVGPDWYELYGGQAQRLTEAPTINRKPIITGSQGLFHRDLPSGKRVQRMDLAEGLMVVENPQTGETREVRFDYSGGGARPMALAATPDGTIAGGTYHPKRFFQYDPRIDEWTRRAIYGQWNTVTTVNDVYYVGSYSVGDLLEWYPARPWVPTHRSNPDSNPRIVAQSPEATREATVPLTILAHPDGRHVIYGGRPAYGCTGGGLVFYDRESGQFEVVSHQRLLPWHSIASLKALPDGRLVGGTDRAPGLGGVRKIEVAELFIMDMATRQVQWHAPLLDGVVRYTDMMVGPDGKVFGFADRTRFFVFDPVERTILHEENVEERFGPTVVYLGPRVFIPIPDGRIFVLFARGIAELNPQTYDITMLATAPVAINNGGAYLDGRLYYATSRNVHSWEVSPIKQ